MKMRLYVQEQHVIKVSELDEFIANKEKNGFKVNDVGYYEEDKKLVIIEKWNKTAC
jgi:hypothetical protein